MQTIFWFAGVLATWYGLKFVFMVFKRLGSKNTINDILDRAEDRMADGADQVAGYFKRKGKKKEQPVVTIR